MKRVPLVIVCGIIFVAPVFLERHAAEAKATRRIKDEYRTAEAPVLRPDSDTPDAEEFLRDLKAIDLAGAPKEVRHAMAAMITSVEENLAVRRAGGDTNAANDRVAAAKRELLRQFDRHRGHRD